MALFWYGTKLYVILLLNIDGTQNVDCGYIFDKNHFITFFILCDVSQLMPYHF